MVLSLLAIERKDQTKTEGSPDTCYAEHTPGSTPYLIGLCQGVNCQGFYVLAALDIFMLFMFCFIAQSQEEKQARFCEL